MEGNTVHITKYIHNGARLVVFSDRFIRILIFCESQETWWKVIAFLSLPRWSGGVNGNQEKMKHIRWQIPDSSIISVALWVNEVVELVRISSKTIISLWSQFWLVLLWLYLRFTPSSYYVPSSQGDDVYVPHMSVCLSSVNSIQRRHFEKLLSLDIR